MKFQCPKGMRDFYPEDMAIRNWISDRWRCVSIRNGFEEYDGPIFESLDLYRQKSGDQIAGELFHFMDRGGREFAIRPEMTPTLARMVAARANTLARPIKWFSIPRLCRAERPQRGRLREFFQWNVDILGSDEALADAECLFVAADLFRELGLAPQQVVLKINSRSLLSSIMQSAGIEPSQAGPIYAVLDKRDKVGPEVFGQMVDDLDLTPDARDLLIHLGEATGPEGLERVGDLVRDHEEGKQQLECLQRTFSLLDVLGVADFCRFDMGVVRGLAYYTGLVFEGFSLGGLGRAVCGGGRYDRLLSDVGGPPLNGVGFATSDVVIQDMLTEFDLLAAHQPATDFFVIDAEPQYFERVLALTASLRASNFAAAFSYKRQSVAKQFKQAAAQRARRAVVVGAETMSDERVQLKDMITGRQRTVSVTALLEEPLQAIDP